MENQHNHKAYKGFEMHLKRITSARPEAEADVMRNILLKDRAKLKEMIANEEIPLDVLKVIMKDRPQQREYMNLIKQSEKEKANPNQVAKREGLSGVFYAGFLIFKIMYYEGEFGIRLISPEED